MLRNDAEQVSKNQDRLAKLFDLLGNNKELLGKLSDRLGKKADLVSKLADRLGKGDDSLGKDEHQPGKLPDRLGNEEELLRKLTDLPEGGHYPRNQGKRPFPNMERVSFLSSANGFANEAPAWFRL